MIVSGSPINSMFPEDFTSLARSEELKRSARKASTSWVETLGGESLSLENYFRFLEEMDQFARDIEAPSLPHPRMEKGKFHL